MSTALTLFGLETATATLATACKLVTVTGGVSANLTTKVGTIQGSGELFSLGSTATFPGTAVSGSAGVHGYLWDVSTLESNTILSGTWTVKFNLNWNATYTTMSSTITARVWKRSSGGTFTKIGSDMTVAGPGASTTAQTLFTLTGSSFPSMAFSTGDKLYLDVWLTVTSTGGATTRTVALWSSSSASAGIAGQVEIDTPGYSPSKVTDTTKMRTPVRSFGPPTGAYTATVLADSPALYYRLGDTSGTAPVDSSGNAYTGALHGTVTLNQAGALTQDSDGSMLFDGSTGYLTASTSLNPAGWTSISLEWWQNLSSVSGFPTMVGNSQTDSTNIGFHIYIDAVSQNITLVVGTGSSFFTAVSTSAISLNTWQHIVVTLSSTTASFYINGSAAGSPSVTFSSLQAETHPLTFGRSATQASDFVAGMLDECAVYHGVLSINRVSAHYTQGSSPSKAISPSIRVPVRTLVTKSVGLRSLIRTQKTVSTAIRTLTRTQKTVSTAVRTLVRTQKALTSGIRAVVKGITKVVGIRTNVRTLATQSVPMRVRARTQHTLSTVLRVVTTAGQLVTKSVVLRVLAQTQQTRSTAVRTLVRTLQSVSVPLRTLVRTLQSRSAPLRTVVRTQINKSTTLRTIVRGITKTVNLRANVRIQITKSVVLRTRVRTLNTQIASIRTRIRTQISQSLALRAIVRGITKITSLRVPVRMLKTLTTTLRTVIRTQATKSTPLRTVARTLRTQSTNLRTVIRSQITKSATLRTVARTQKTVSFGLRAIVSTVGTLVTRSTALRLVIRTRKSVTSTLRMLVKTQASKNTVFRTLIRTGNTLNTVIRALVRSQVNKSTPIRARVRSLVTKSISIRATIKTQNILSSKLRALIRSQVTKTTALRTLIRTPHSITMPLRTFIRSQSIQITALRAVIQGITQIAQIRIHLRTGKTSTTILRILVKNPFVYKLIRLRMHVRSQHVAYFALRVMVLPEAPSAITRLKNRDGHAFLINHDGYTILKDRGE